MLFAYTLFQIFKKHTYNILKNLAQFFAHTLFQILKKVYLQISKIPGTIFLLIPFFQIFKIPETIFQIFKKAYLQISKYLFHTDNNFKGNNLHKNHYTNNSHKNHYTNR